MRRMNEVRLHKTGLRVSQTEAPLCMNGIIGMLTEIPRQMTRAILGLAEIGRHLTEVMRRLIGFIHRMIAVR